MRCGKFTINIDFFDILEIFIDWFPEETLGFLGLGYDLLLGKGRVGLISRTLRRYYCIPYHSS